MMVGASGGADRGFDGLRFRVELHDNSSSFKLSCFTEVEACLLREAVDIELLNGSFDRAEAWESSIGKPAKKGENIWTTTPTSILEGDAYNHGH